MGNNCGCTPKPCVTTNCACDVLISSDCVNKVTALFSCSEIATGLTLTETLEQLDQYICQLFSSTTNYFTLINVGGGIEVYKGVDNLGQKQIRTLISQGDIITVTQNTDTIAVGVDEEALTTFVQNSAPSVANVGVGEGLYKNTTSNTFNFKTLKSSDNTVTVTPSTDEIDLTVDVGLTEGTNVTITEPTPNHFVINSTFHIQALVDQGINVTGTGTVSDPVLLSVDPTFLPDGSTMYDTKDIIIPDITYFNNNFDSNISSPTYGLGKNLRLGWAIMNGNNGTPNDAETANVSWDSLTQPFSAVETHIGSANSVLLGHSHTVTPTQDPTFGAGGAVRTTWGASAGDTSAGGDTVPLVTSTAGGSETGVGKNIPPSVIRARIMKIN